MWGDPPANEGKEGREGQKNTHKHKNVQYNSSGRHKFIKKIVNTTDLRTLLSEQHLYSFIYSARGHTSIPSSGRSLERPVSTNRTV